MITPPLSPLRAASEVRTFVPHCQVAAVLLIVPRRPVSVLSAQAIERAPYTDITMLVS
jgi:hypothetical protein